MLQPNLKNANQFAAEEAQSGNLADPGNSLLELEAEALFDFSEFHENIFAVNFDFMRVSVLRRGHAECLATADVKFGAMSRASNFVPCMISIAQCAPIVGAHIVEAKILLSYLEEDHKTFVDFHKKLFAIIDFGNCASSVKIGHVFFQAYEWMEPPVHQKDLVAEDS